MKEYFVYYQLIEPAYDEDDFYLEDFDTIEELDEAVEILLTCGYQSTMNGNIKVSVIAAGKVEKFFKYEAVTKITKFARI